MALEDATDGIVVLREHLEEWLDVIHRNYSQLLALDLVHNYRTGRSQTTQLTRMTERAHNRIEGYLENESLSSE